MAKCWTSCGKCGTIKEINIPDSEFTHPKDTNRLVLKNYFRLNGWQILPTRCPKCQTDYEREQLENEPDGTIE